MPVFNRTSIPDKIRYNKKDYVFDAKKSGEFSQSKKKPKEKHVFVDVLSRSLRGKTDLHHQPYKPSRFIFVLEKDLMRTFHFNTGVHISVNSAIKGGINSGNGIVVIPFDCKDVPERAIFMYACDKIEEDTNDAICREIYNSELGSKYAYFTIFHINVNP